MFTRYIFNSNRIMSLSKKFFSNGYLNKIKPKSSQVTATMVGSFLIYSLSKNFNSFSSEETIKHRLDGYINMKDGEMKSFKYGTKDHETILIAKYNGKFHALSNSCPHFGAPLHTGVMIDNIIKCPWHGANFDVETGMTDLYPSIDSLSKYEINEVNGELEVTLPKVMKASKVNEMSKRDPSDNRVYIIVGGGPAALAGAETLRQMGFTGQIIILTEENYTPYDKTGLTKWMVPSIDKVSLRNDNFLTEYDLEVRKNMRVTGIDTVENTVKVDNLLDGSQDKIVYDKCLLAMGSAPIIPKIPGNDLKGVLTMRSYQDFEKIKARVKDAKDIVIVGGSFIGLESASNLKKANKNAKITIIDNTEFPFERILGKEIGKAVQKLHLDNGIQFKMKSTVTNINGKDDNVTSVLTSDGTEIIADMVLFGTGVSPKTEILNDAVTLDNKTVKCNGFLQTSNNNIFAAGDVCSFPYSQTGERIYFAHYTLAQQQGAVAAMNMLGQKVTFDYIPFFWTRFWDKALQYVSINNGSFDEVFIDGNMVDLTFCAYYLKNNKVVSFAAMNSPNAVNLVYEAMRANVMPNGNAIKSGRANIDTIKNNLKGVKVKCSRVNCLCAARKNKI